MLNDKLSHTIHNKLMAALHVTMTFTHSLSLINDLDCVKSSCVNCKPTW